MVKDTLNSISEAAKELETINNETHSERMLSDMREVATQTAISAAEVAEAWGKNTLEKTKDIIQEVIL